MPGQEEIEITDPENTASEDFRLELFTDNYYKRFSEVFPEFTTEQAKKALALSEEFAKDKIRTEDSADNDQLTALPNRRGFRRQFERILLQHQRNLKDGKTTPLSIIYLDLDGFKKVNEKYEHQTGDQVLSAFGQHLLINIRPKDIAGRLGGEEFAVLLYNTSLENAVIVADRLRINTSDLFNTLFPTLEWPKTISIGVFQLPEMTLPQLAYEQDRMKIIDQSIHQADRAQSDGAKHAGKNRIGVVLPNDSIETAIVTEEPNNQTGCLIQYEQPNTQLDNYFKT